MFEVKDALEKELDQEPTPQQLADTLGISLKKVQMLESLSQPVVSLQKPVDQSGELTVADTIALEDQSALLEEELIERETSKVVEEVLNQLKPREQTIIRMRFGFEDNNKDQTFDAIGQRLNLTPERVRQIYNEVMKQQLPSLASMHGLRDLLD